MYIRVKVDYDKMQERIMKRGTTLSKCAKIVGVHRSTLTNAIKRNSTMNYDSLVSIANYLEIPVSNLICKDDCENRRTDGMDQYAKSSDGYETEVCPHCSREVSIVWDINQDGFKAYCPFCGKRLMLCDACKHRNGDYYDDCDYDSDTGFCMMQKMSEFEAMATLTLADGTSGMLADILMQKARQDKEASAELRSAALKVLKKSKSERDAMLKNANHLNLGK